MGVLGPHGHGGRPGWPRTGHRLGGATVGSGRAWAWTCPGGERWDSPPVCRARPQAWPSPSHGRSVPSARCQPRSRLPVSTALRGQAVAHRLRRVRAAAQGHPPRSPAPRRPAGWQPLLPMFVWEQAQAGALSCLKSPGGGSQATVPSPPSHPGPHPIFPGGSSSKAEAQAGPSRTVACPAGWLCAGDRAQAPDSLSGHGAGRRWV